MTRSVTEYITASARPKYDLPLTVKGSLLWLSDIEIPFHYHQFLNNSIDLALAYGIKQCVLGGDILHLEAFSPFPGADTNAGEEITEIEEYLPMLIEPFEKLYWLMGNHDDRALRVMERKIKVEQVMRLFVSPKTHQKFHQRVTISDYYWMYAGYEWQLEHAKNNRMMPASTAKALAEKFHKNIVMGHTHVWGQVQDVSGQFTAIESGCCVDTERLAYPNLRHSTRTKMQNGSVLLIDTGRMYTPMLLSPTRTDFEWEKWRAKNYQKSLRRY